MKRVIQVFISIFTNLFINKKICNCLWRFNFLQNVTFIFYLNRIIIIHFIIYNQSFTISVKNVKLWITQWLYTKLLCFSYYGLYIYFIKKKKSFVRIERCLFSIISVMFEIKGEYNMKLSWYCRFLRRVIFYFFFLII